MAEAATEPDLDPEVLMEIAERFLNDQGQVEVSVLVDDGHLRRAQAYLLGALDKAMTDGQLTDEEAPGIYAQLGLSARDVERLRTHSAHQW